MRQNALKRLLSVLLLTLFVVGLLACKKTGGETAEASASEAESAQQLAFRITWTDYSGRGQAIQKIVDGYNALSTEDEPVQMIGGDEDHAHHDR